MTRVHPQVFYGDIPDKKRKGRPKNVEIPPKPYDKYPPDTRPNVFVLARVYLGNRFRDHGTHCTLDGSRIQPADIMRAVNVERIKQGLPQYTRNSQWVVR